MEKSVNSIEGRAISLLNSHKIKSLIGKLKLMGYPTKIDYSFPGEDFITPSLYLVDNPIKIEKFS